MLIGAIHPSPGGQHRLHTLNDVSLVLGNSAAKEGAIYEQIEVNQNTARVDVEQYIGNPEVPSDWVRSSRFGLEGNTELFVSRQAQPKDQGI